MGTQIADLRRKVESGDYELTGHAKEEMEQDGFSIADVKSAILTGKIVRLQRHGGRTKYVVEGWANGRRWLNRRSLRAVCRLTAFGRLRIITVFVVRS